ncbi:MAG: hypothetical protein ACP5I7_02820 [Sulfolobales archaeon]
MTLRIHLNNHMRVASALIDLYEYLVENKCEKLFDPIVDRIQIIYQKKISGGEYRFRCRNIVIIVRSVAQDIVDIEFRRYLNM